MSETYMTKCFRVIFSNFTAEVLVSIDGDRRSFSLLTENNELEGATISDGDGSQIGSVANGAATMVCRKFNKIPVFSVKDKTGAQGRLEEFEPEDNGSTYIATRA